MPRRVHSQQPVAPAKRRTAAVAAAAIDGTACTAPRRRGRHASGGTVSTAPCCRRLLLDAAATVAVAVAAGGRLLLGVAATAVAVAVAGGRGPPARQLSTTTMGPALPKQVLISTLSGTAAAYYSHNVQFYSFCAGQLHTSGFIHASTMWQWSWLS